MKRTTDLNKLRAGEPFTWGKAIRIHDIAEYSIVECFQWKREGVSVLMGMADINTLSFHCYVNGQDLGISADSMDAAIITCISYKHEGANTHAPYYFMKMIKRENS